MHLLPTQDDVVRILRETGALRAGHFEFPDGVHSDEYLQVPVAMRNFQQAKTLSVGLSRLLRANSEIRAGIRKLSIVTPGMGGLPVAQGICEALQANKVYWAERERSGGDYRFRPFLEPEAGEQVMLVDDILHSGRNLADLKATIEGFKAHVVGLAVIVYQPAPATRSFGDLPLYHLATLNQGYYASAADCKLCKEGKPLIRVWL